MSQKMFLSFHTLPFRSAKIRTITHETGVQCYRTTFHTVWIPFLLILFVRCTLGSIYTLSGTATFLVEGNGTERYMGRNRTLTAAETSKRNDRKIPFLEKTARSFDSYCTCTFMGTWTHPLVSPSFLLSFPLLLFLHLSHFFFSSICLSSFPTSPLSFSLFPFLCPSLFFFSSRIICPKRLYLGSAIFTEPQNVFLPFRMIN